MISRVTGQAEIALGSTILIVFVPQIHEQFDRRWAVPAVVISGALRCGFVGFAPDGSVMAVVARGEGDVYSLELNLP